MPSPVLLCLTARSVPAEIFFLWYLEVFLQVNCLVYLLDLAYHDHLDSAFSLMKGTLWYITHLLTLVVKQEKNNLISWKIIFHDVIWQIYNVAYSYIFICVPVSCEWTRNYFSIYIQEGIPFLRVSCCFKECNYGILLHDFQDI